MTAGGSAVKKKQRVGSSSRLSTSADPDFSFPAETLTEGSDRLPSVHSSSSRSPLPVVPSPGGFNDAYTADVILSLFQEHSDSEMSEAASDYKLPEIQIYLHSHVIVRSKYFSSLLSNRWKQQTESSCDNSENGSKFYRLQLSVPDGSFSINHHVTVLQLLYSNDVLPSINSVSLTLNLLPVALELLFEDCIKACVKYLEAVPWSEDEENMILNLIPLLSGEESEYLLARVCPVNNNSSDEMLYGLILSAIYNHPNTAFPKAFLAKLLRDFPSRQSARRALEKAFEMSLRVVKQSLEEYSSPDLRGDHNETEAIQRLNLLKAMTNGKHLLWLVERMIELKVADTAVKVWSEQDSLTVDLQRAFRDDAWRNIVPSLPAVVLRCTSRLANAVATGNILASKQVRLKLVKEWLPVLILCKDNLAVMGTSQKSLYLELEETFLIIISTLPLSDAEVLLQQCLSFSTRNVDDCPHLVAAFTTWFRRAKRPPQADFL